MRHHDDPGAARNQCLDCRREALDASGVGDLAVLDRHVEVGAQQYALTPDIEIVDRMKPRHRPAPLLELAVAIKADRDGALQTARGGLIAGHHGDRPRQAALRRRADGAGLMVLWPEAAGDAAVKADAAARAAQGSGDARSAAHPR